MDYSWFNTDTDENNFVYDQYKPYLSVKVDYKGFGFQSDYSWQYLNNNTGKQTFHSLNLSLFYRKPDTAWGFEIYVQNALNQQYKVSYNYLSYLSKINTTYLQASILMFKLHYKL
jgi:outer membrane receptor protein involved in Fe transport